MWFDRKLTPKQRERIEKKLSRGRRSFIWRFGVLGWGIPVFLMTLPGTTTTVIVRISLLIPPTLFFTWQWACRFGWRADIGLAPSCGGVSTISSKPISGRPMHDGEALYFKYNNVEDKNGGPHRPPLTISQWLKAKCLRSSSPGILPARP